MTCLTDILPPGGPQPLPYSLKSDDLLAGILLACFLFTAFVLSRNSKFLYQLLKNFLLHRERNSIFASSTELDMRLLLALIVQTCVLGGICLYGYSAGACPRLLGHIPAPLLLAIFMGLCCTVLCVKWVLYSVVCWTFFDRAKTGIWFESYSTLLYYLGFALFPLALLIVYFDLSYKIMLILSLFLFLFFKILTFFKWLKLFCNELHGLFLLILYFCALEVIPYFVIYKYATDYLTKTITG